jgi:hypothetical protein
VLSRLPEFLEAAFEITIAVGLALVAVEMFLFLLVGAFERAAAGLHKRRLQVIRERRLSELSRQGDVAVPQLGARRTSVD